MAAFAAGAVVAALAAGTLVRPDHTNPPTDPAHPLRSRIGNTSHALPSSIVRPEARLSSRDVETICTTSQKEVDDANDQGSRF